MNKLLRILIIAFVLISADASAQFYNGHQMDFGKNRVQYSEFEWMFYRYPKFDTYFYQQGKDIAQYTCDRAGVIIPEMEKFFDKTLQRRIVFIVFNRIEEFRQSNIGLETDNSQSNLGGVAKILDNKVFLYFDGDHNRYDAQIREAVAQILLGVSINGNGLKNKVSTSSSMALPEWYSSGLSYYAANQWNAGIEDVLRDGFQSGKYRKIQFLSGDDAKYAGYSMWYFINRNFGRDAVSRILYFTGINKDCNVAINQVLNVKFRKLNKQWVEYYREKFGVSDAAAKASAPQENGLILGKYRRNTIYDNPMQSPDGKYTFYATDKEGKTKVMLMDNETGKASKILRRGQPLEQVQEHNYPVAAWHPTGRILSFVIEEQGYAYLYQYNVETAALSRRMLPRFDKVFSMDYSDEGLDMVLSVQMSGMTDILVMNIASGSFESITQDQADDIDPKFIENGTKIIFASNRLSDTLRAEKIDDHDKFGKTYDIFVYDYKNRSNVLRRVTDTKYENETAPDELAANSYTYLSDRSGIVNRYASVYDSTIIAIDTIVHYSYSNRYSHVSDFGSNAQSMSLSRERRSLDFSFRNKGRYLMRRESLDADRSALPAELSTTYFRQVMDKRQAKADSLEAAKARKAAAERRRTDSIVANPPKNLVNPDSLRYDILNYYFEEEKSLAHQLIFYGEDIKARHAREKAERPNQRMYFTNFYTDYLVTQVDFSSLSQGYQPFTGGPYYFDPGVSAFFKVGCKDLFEDYRLSAAFRMGGNFDSYEYYFSFEDLKHRLDKQYVFHRSSYNKDLGGYSVAKVVSNEGMFVARYPFTPTSAVKGTLGLRYDKAQYQVTDVQYLNQKPQHQLFAKAKAEYVFDNSRMITTNIPSGVKFKGWTELYQQLEGNYDIVSSVGFDFRYYQRISRCLIFASRIAGATSFGTGKILYYLGGVDNWQTFTNNTAKRFDQSVRIDPDENYIYQAVGTNMRGFIQNARNGNTFAVMNNEIRFPVFRYLVNRPINRKWINDFQVVGFFDAGSAWTGLIPGKDNAYNKYEVTDGSITMIMDVARPSMVVGYGWGLRTTLLGYFLRFDWSWGLEGKVVLPRTFYFSLGFDF
ncbi:MAG: hypothetical protein MJZ66_05920 [Bacteroidales bacterium]|nr:hypothetical protein [Bacteroidales bacterium]